MDFHIIKICNLDKLLRTYDSQFSTILVMRKGIKKGDDMIRTEILEELKKLSLKERLEIIESAIHLLQEDLQQVERSSSRIERKRQLAAAAEVLLPDYQKNDELIIFTSLDSVAGYCAGH